MNLQYDALDRSATLTDLNFTILTHVLSGQGLFHDKTGPIIELLSNSKKLCHGQSLHLIKSILSLYLSLSLSLFFSLSLTLLLSNSMYLCLPFNSFI